MDNNFRIEKLSWEEVVGQKIEPLKAPVARIMRVHPPTHLYHPPNQFWPSAARLTMSQHLPSFSRGQLAYLGLVHPVHYGFGWAMSFGHGQPGSHW